jgi:hypothetical protein
VSMIGTVSFVKVIRIQGTAVSWEDYGRCVLGFRRSDLC